MQKTWFQAQQWISLVRQSQRFAVGLIIMASVLMVGALIIRNSLTVLLSFALGFWGFKWLKLPPRIVRWGEVLFILVPSLIASLLFVADNKIGSVVWSLLALSIAKVASNESGEQLANIITVVVMLVCMAGLGSAWQAENPQDFIIWVLVLFVFLGIAQFTHSRRDARHTREREERRLALDAQKIKIDQQILANASRERDAQSPPTPSVSNSLPESQQTPPASDRSNAAATLPQPSNQVPQVERTERPVQVIINNLIPVVQNTQVLVGQSLHNVVEKDTHPIILPAPPPNKPESPQTTTEVAQDLNTTPSSQAQSQGQDELATQFVSTAMNPDTETSHQKEQVKPSLDPQSNVQTPQTLPPWEIIEDHLWDRKALKLWCEGYTCKEISERTSCASADRIRNRLTELRKIYGEKIVPIGNDRQRRANKAMRTKE